MSKKIASVQVTCLCAILLSGAFIGIQAKSADKKPEVPSKSSGPVVVDSVEKDYSTELPKIAAKTPVESLQAMKLKSGFHAELVVSEPLIRSPMGMDFDEYGRAFVVELPEYNQYASAQPHGKGSIKRLEDTNGDGQYDQATVYVDNLDYPTAVACWDGGILVGVAPDLLYCKDTDGDGKADIRKKLFTGFGQDKAGEGMLNSFRWRMDNQFHIPTGLDGGDISRVDGEVPSTAGIIASTKPVNARGQHLLLEPKSMTITATSGGGQHGMSLDDWNLRGFVCGNSEPVHLVMYDGRYLARNPYLQAPAAAINIAPDGKFTRLMRISDIEPWRVLRTRLRKTGVIPGSDEGGAASGFFTGATGITCYRGDAWPAEYRGQVFVGEVANNLVYRARLEPHGVGLTAHRADPDSEFLASADNWFRPVQFANAPDGTLYVLDMYRQLIEGAAFLAPTILKHMDTSAGANQGRIYRIAPDGFRFQSPPSLGDWPTDKLVQLLEHTNGWHRDTASRLIYQRQDTSAVPPLRQLAATSGTPLARILALYSLRGLGSLDVSQVVDALKLEEPRARIHALKLSEAFSDRAEVKTAVLGLVHDPELTVRYQVAFTLGAFSGDAVTKALADLAIQDGTDPWFQLAILSSISNQRGEFLSALLSDATFRSKSFVRQMLSSVAVQIAANNSPSEMAIVIKELDKLAATDPALAQELVRNLISKQPAVREMLAGVTGGKAAEILAQLIAEAIRIAENEQKSPMERAAAVRTLASSQLADTHELFQKLLGSRQPQPVQAAALETLARFNANEVPGLIIEAWPSQTPLLRTTSIETLFTRKNWISAFLDAVEAQTISRADLDSARISLLQKHSDTGIRDRAAKLFAGNALARRQEVVDAYQKVLDVKGDVDRGRAHFRKICAACHKLENFGESLGADLNAIKDRGNAAVMLNILDPNREVKPQFMSYVVVLDSGRSLSGMITAENANSLSIRKADNTTETVLRVEVDELKSSNMSFMPEGLEKQLDHTAMADLLAYLNSIK